MDLPRGLPPRLYVDDEVFAAERERIFGGSWLPVCRTEDVARPGDYVAREVGGEPVVVAQRATVGSPRSPACVATATWSC
ncbi:hypothetical protein [Actinomarinicola tropica]|uniref:Uncharacterized protein n=1 Tax=Actinomarinicola tropica TaxID=2789776 RepID=A0A5Q2RK70_9ACTN|nr:hypothetical protein [Actinomarinicola tropica]QGG94796.1 hypothetical protein GH723_06540 [Actinomarinicola tropica]